ncbi:MAG: hypothetical protein ACHP7N_06645 [Caulobacterales bacterium]
MGARAADVSRFSDITVGRRRRERRQLSVASPAHPDDGSSCRGTAMAEHEDESEPAQEPAGVSPAAVSLALARAPDSDAINTKAAEFLDKQSRMLDLQMENFGEVQALHHRHLRLKYFGDRLRIGLQLLAIILGLFVVVGLGALVWQAHEDHGLVVEAFSVPPDLAQRGLTGQVIASRLLDKLADMQDQTASLRPANSYANNWGSDLKVEIPETGVSIGEARQLLTAWLGHETHITGEVFRTPAGLAVAARTAGAPAKTYEGVDADLDKLLQQAAEAVYGSTQPYRYAVFLDQHGRAGEATPRLELLARNGSPIDRYSAAYYLGFQALDAGELGRGMATLGAAIQADPTSGHAYWLRGQVEWVAGHSEAALQDSLKAAQLLSGALDPFGDPAQRDVDLPLADETVAEFEGNWREAAAQGDKARAALARIGGHEFSGEDVGYAALESVDLAQDHDAASAQALAARAGLPQAPGSGVVGVMGPVAGFRIWRERAAEDWPAVVNEAPYIVGDHAEAGAEALRLPITMSAFAFSLAKTGRMPEAEAISSATPLDCYACLIDRGAIAAMNQDWPTAQRWFAEAVRQGPSLPFAHLEWGRMLVAEGDVGGAMQQLDLARQKGPHFADPAEFMGEVLMRKGDWAGAAAKFGEADRDAPRWGRNHMLWGQALARLGRMDEARAQYRAAAGMDLSAADRATLASLANAR